MIKYHNDFIQGDDAWKAARCGRLTSSEMERIITPTKLQYAENDKARAHLNELLAQRITKYVEPQYISDAMLRGQGDESYARETYHENYAKVEMCGFITNDKFMFILGYSPDGLVGNDGLIECKSRVQKYQLETIISNEVPAEYTIQLQTELLISEREWVDFISYCGGLPMFTKRVYPDEKIQKAILEAANIFHEKLDIAMTSYNKQLNNPDIKLIPTQRHIETEMHL